MLIRSLLVGLLLAAAAGRVADAQSSDALLAARAIDAVRGYVHFSIFDDVTVSVARGVVRLDGRVTMPFKREEIGARVAKVAGGREVANEIQVLPFIGSDIDLRRTVAAAIYGHPAFWAYASMAHPPIHIIVERGQVRLTGVVNNQVEKRLAYALAQVPGAFGVTNELRIEGAGP
jgi:osmotically-inducible protein OsmY